MRVPGICGVQQNGLSASATLDAGASYEYKSSALRISSLPYLLAIIHTSATAATARPRKHVYYPPAQYLPHIAITQPIPHHGNHIRLQLLYQPKTPIPHFPSIPSMLVLAQFYQWMTYGSSHSFSEGDPWLLHDFAPRALFPMPFSLRHCSQAVTRHPRNLLPFRCPGTARFMADNSR
jgi:hypothetical protein